MILSIAAHRQALATKARLASPLPYCGLCVDAGDGIHDLISCKRYDGPDSAYCPMCGTEFR